MTTTQTSFSAFAATQTDPGNFAVSDQSGQRGCFLPSFPYPLPSFSVNRVFGTGVPHTSGLRDDFYLDYVESLDATESLPMGGHDSMDFGRCSGFYFEVVAFGVVARGR